MRLLLVRFVREDLGQDLIEYGLLALVIGTVGILAWDSVRTELGSKYQNWDTGVQDLWEPEDPITP
jgi:Flp pilus assembly pilin Flp